MPIDIFGFSIGKKGKESPRPSTNELEKNKSYKSFVGPDEYDGSFELAGGGVYGQYVDFSGQIRDENDLIRRYRSMAVFPEVDIAITDVVNDAIVIDDDKKPVELNLDSVDISDNIKDKMYTEFDNVLKILNFKNKGNDIFRRWYVDSKIYYHIIIDESSPKKGIQELRPIDPVKIQKIKTINKENISKNGVSVPVVKSVEEFFLYTEPDKNSSTFTGTTGLKIAPDSICYSHSGVVDSGTKRVVGYLQKAIRPLNMLRQIEDAVVVYRISRAPERRIFYIDVGNLPKQKAEQYIQSLMNKYKNKIMYDASTGEIQDDRRHMSMLEDYWLPRREGGRGTEISTLDGGQNLGEMEDVDYLLKKLYRALHIPVSRMESDNGFNMGRSAEITRDEVKFYKWITRLQNRFNEMFLQLLKTQLIIKGIIRQEDWDNIYQDVSFVYKKDSYFTELKESEIMKERLEMLRDLDEYIGRYYSIEYVRKNILGQSVQDIEEIDTQIKKETASGDIESGSEEEEGEE